MRVKQLTLDWSIDHNYLIKVRIDHFSSKNSNEIGADPVCEISINPWFEKKKTHFYRLQMVLYFEHLSWSSIFRKRLFSEPWMQIIKIPDEKTEKTAKLEIGVFALNAFLLCIVAFVQCVCPPLVRYAPFSSNWTKQLSYFFPAAQVENTLFEQNTCKSWSFAFWILLAKDGNRDLFRMS